MLSIAHAITAQQSVVLTIKQRQASEQHGVTQHAKRQRKIGSKV